MPAVHLYLHKLDNDHQCKPSPPLGSWGGFLPSSLVPLFFVLRLLSQGKPFCLAGWKVVLRKREPTTAKTPLFFSAFSSSLSLHPCMLPISLPPCFSLCFPPSLSSPPPFPKHIFVRHSYLHHYNLVRGGSAVIPDSAPSRQFHSHSTSIGTSS